ncbi:hypothetical protein ACFOYW_10745 [Gryllotalpicola reticulitermitis]|uniref:Uncharacterized protein n=1 Tax=Gryllotalpicola reticulitermitis TaxID=1184153 RepID=A0ABV8Q958_9MICO
MNDGKDGVQRATEWLDDKLVPILGPAPNGPFESDRAEDPRPGVTDELCPVCHHAMSRHTEEVEPGTNRVFRRCPDGTIVETEVEATTHPGDENTQDGPVLS